MPIITFESGKLPDKIKSELIQELINTSAQITGIPKEVFMISIREMPDENEAITSVNRGRARPWSVLGN